ncbi:tetratricopeptide repeat-containing sulfotransferase family protein [Magnetovibrio blakemorei]|uniref:tetratricopeptide repeat-containing sulfotransferase family protein n=1 Tax=Magnetovibrio blakemorei TaxID=28181 RepID=UPI00147B394A|nr:sulfotransferase [Magnetovibrio blakemorei]
MRTAIAALNLGRFDFAQKLALRLLSVHRESSDAYNAYNILGVVNMVNGQYAKALAHFTKALKLKPGDAQTHLNMAEALNALNKASLAYEHLEHALRLEPHAPQVHYAMGTTCRAIGDADRAEEMFRATLSLDPFHPFAWKSLAEMGRSTMGQDTERMMEAVSHFQNAPHQRAQVLFALFATFERAKEDDQAFAFLEQANQLVASVQNYDVSDDEQWMQSIAEAFPKDRLDGLVSPNQVTPRPIFIVGMPRSGTTLVEQVIAGHSDVQACGELPFLSAAVEFIGARPGLNYPDTVARWKGKDIKKIAADYLDEVKSFDITQPNFTDKMPGNFPYLGVVALAFPNARIIHCQRDPIDTCLANYRQMFTEQHRYTFDQGDLVRYFKAYSNLMAHWRSVMGAQILDVSYEALVENPEDQARRIIAFCDLPWEDECLNVGQSDRSIRTASASQVREGIHKNFVARWKRYEKHIQVLIEGLSR